MPFFSIIIPTYNRSSIICRNILSLTKQSFQNFEIIVIDDGSTDDTEERVKILQKSIANLSYYYQSNAERSVARNNGVSRAKGKYIICLDSDDFFSDNHLDLLSQFSPIKNKEVCAVISGYNYDTNGVVSAGIFNKIPLQNKQLYFFQNPVIPARVCLHRNIFKDFSYDPEITIVEDAILWAQVSTKYNIYELEEPTVYYALHEDNSVNVKNYSAIKRLNGLKKYFQRDISNEIDMSDKRELLADCYYRIAKSDEYHGKTVSFRRNILRSIKVKPKSKTSKYKIFEILSSFYLFRKLWKIKRS